MFEQMPRSRVEIGLIHFERLEDILVNVDFVILFGEQFYDAAEKDYAQVGIAELRSRLKQNLRVRHHRHELRPVLRLVWMPVFVAPPWPCRRAKSGRVRHQMPDRDLAHVTEGIVNCAQFGQVFKYRLVEFQQTAIAQLHDGDAGKRLGDRSPMENRVFVHRVLYFNISEAEELLRDDLPVLNEHEAAADDAVLAHRLLVKGFEFAAGLGEVSWGLTMGHV